MLKRAVTGILWTYAAYTGWKLGAGLLDLPQYLDLVAMVASATLGGVMAWRMVPTTGEPNRRIARIPHRAVPGEGAAPKPLP
jgi:hypothetical protein